MNSDIKPIDITYGPAIGWFRGQVIHQSIDFGNECYVYDRLAVALPSGAIALSQLQEDERLFAPGFIYKRLATQKSDFDNTDGGKEPEKSGADTEKEHSKLPTQPSTFRQTLAKLAGFYAFHWWRIATLRPAFTQLSDRRENLFVFGALYFALGLLRWLSVDSQSVADVLQHLTFSAVLIFAISIRPKQSLTLAVALLASSAAVDLVATIAGVLGFTFVPNMTYIFLESLMYIVSMRSFYHGPKPVRSSGYKAPKQDL